MDEFSAQDKKNNGKLKVIIFSIVGVIVVVAIAVVSFLFGKSMVPEQPTSTTTQPTNTTSTTETAWKELASAQKGFPVRNTDSGEKDNVVKFYSLATKKVVTLKNAKLGYGGGAAGQGTSDPLASPNLLYTAYIGDDQNLWLVSHETQKTKQLTSDGFVSYINDWSPDSKKIVYYVEPDTIAKRNNIPHGYSEKLDFKLQKSKGFYEFNVTTGEDTPLTAIEYSEGYIDNNTLLVKQDSESETLITFDTKKLTANQGIVKQKANFGTGPYDFSSDGKLWTYHDAVDVKNPTEGEVRILVGSFPGVASTVVDSGSWADLQAPHFSPDAKKIAYEKSTGLNSEGVPNSSVWVYDMAAKTKTEYSKGRPLQWTDNKTVLIEQTTSKGEVSKLILLDLTTKKETTVYNY